jgi:hypothetical protein
VSTRPAHVPSTPAFGPQAHALPLTRPDVVAGRHPLEDSEQLAWQATDAVSLLERFGDLVIVALDAVGRGADDELERALRDRGALVQELQPLLGALAAAREYMIGCPPHTAAARAVAEILAPVDDALRHAQLLHSRLSDEVRERGWDAGRPRMTIVR